MTSRGAVGLSMERPCARGGVGVGRWVYRSVVIGSGFFVSGGVLIAILIGKIEADPGPWAMALMTAGLPTLIVFMLLMMNVISEDTELRFLVGSYWICTLADAGYLAFSSQLGMEDLWMKASVAPVGYIVWNSTLHAIDIGSKTNSGLKKCLPLILLTCSVLIRSMWDSKLQGILMSSFMVLILFQAASVMLQVHHAETCRAGMELSVEKRIQESLLDIAFDATVQVAKATSTPLPDLLVVKCSHSFNACVGKNMQGRMLSECMSEGVDQLLEVMLAAEETQWRDTAAKGRMCRALVTCIDEESVETDFEVLVVARAPESGTDSGGLICGLRKAGESRPPAARSSRVQKDPSGSPYVASSLRPLPGFGNILDDSMGKRMDRAQQVHPSAEAMRPTSPTRKSSGITTVHSQQEKQVQSSRGWSMLQQLSRSLAQNIQSAVKLKAASVNVVEEHTLNCQSMAWQTLCQAPLVRAFWCSRDNLTIVNATSAATEQFAVAPGHHISSLFQEASHAVLLRKAVQFTSEKLDASLPPDARFLVGRTMELPLRDASLNVKDVRVTLVFLPGVMAGAIPPAVFLVIGPVPHYTYLEIHNKKDDDLQETIYPDESASLCGSSNESGCPSGMARRHLYDSQET